MIKKRNKSQFVVVFLQNHPSMYWIRFEPTVEVNSMKHNFFAANFFCARKSWSEGVGQGYGRTRYCQLSTRWHWHSLSTYCLSIAPGEQDTLDSYSIELYVAAMKPKLPLHTNSPLTTPSRTALRDCSISESIQFILDSLCSPKYEVNVKHKFPTPCKLAISVQSNCGAFTFLSMLELITAHLPLKLSFFYYFRPPSLTILFNHPLS